MPESVQLFRPGQTVDFRNELLREEFMCEYGYSTPDGPYKVSTIIHVSDACNCPAATLGVDHYDYCRVTFRKRNGHPQMLHVVVSGILGTLRVSGKYFTTKSSTHGIKPGDWVLYKGRNERIAVVGNGTVAFRSDMCHRVPISEVVHQT